AERLNLLVRYQAALRSGDPATLAKAAADLGKAAAASPDAGFGTEAVEVLANLSAAAAVSPGLEAAVKSDFPEVRARVFEALAWRGRQEDPAALEALAKAFIAEKNA